MNFIATGIGSVPFSDTEYACRLILDCLPHAPFWPQMVKVNPREDMLVQFCEGFLFLDIDCEAKSIHISPEDTELKLADFYALYLEEAVNEFKMTPQYAEGLFKLLSMVKDSGSGEYIKGQIVGPITMASSVKDRSGKAVLTNPDMFDAIVKGISIKALWQIRELKKTKRKVILFLDEPSLSGFGSAFSSIERGQVISALREVFDYLRTKEQDTMLGIHCCGNTDWAMIVEAGPDIINFDAYDYMEHFLLYPEKIAEFISKGGVIAWGIVPTFSFKGSETIELLRSRLLSGIDVLKQKGVDKARLQTQSLLTPSCGMGTMNEDSSITALKLLSELSEEMNSTQLYSS